MKGVFFCIFIGRFNVQKAKTIIPEKVKIFEIYNSYVPFFEVIKNNIHDKLASSIKLSSQPTYKKRIKSFQSYYTKILRLKSKQIDNSSSLICLTDMIGIRIICTFLEDVTIVKEQIQKIFDVKEIEIKGESQSFKEFGYESVHVLVKVPDDCMPSQKFYDKNGLELKLPDDLVCEIQIRTILQDAWAEVEHELIYKSEFTPFDMPLKRKLASMNASLSLADIIFQEIRDYQKKLQIEMNERHRSFYEKADELTNDSLAIPYETENKIQRLNPYIRGTVDDMLLEAIQCHNNGNLDKAIYIYSQILESKTQLNDIVLSVIFKHRGMAYFTKNDYENALKDFKTSCKFDPKNSRSFYYQGIVFSIQKDFQSAVENFSISLELNEYQSHAYLRRALAFFELGQYEDSMNDLESARKLGLDEKELKPLHSKLIDKFDMKV